MVHFMLVGAINGENVRRLLQMVVILCGSGAFNELASWLEFSLLRHWKLRCDLLWQRPAGSCMAWSWKTWLACGLELPSVLGSRRSGHSGTNIMFLLLDLLVHKFMLTVHLLRVAGLSRLA